MPLLIEGQPMPMPTSVPDFIKTYPQFQIQARQLKSMPVIDIDPQDPYLYVHQAESVCVSAEDPNILRIGVDNVTTCCCVVVRHSGSLAMAVGHFDGNDTVDGLNRMLEGVTELTKEWMIRNNINQAELNTRYRFEVCLIGGFEDARNISIDVIMQLLEALLMTPLQLHLKIASVYSNNTYYRNNIPYPSIIGLICDIQSGGLAPASFKFQGPLEEIRQLRFAMRPPIIMHSVYNPYTRILEVKPYEWTITNDTIQQLLGLNVNSFLHYWSTSPLAEKPDFVPSCKKALKFLEENRESLFPSGRSYKFTRSNGQWNLIEQ